jgi:hypothetical protein
MNDENEILLAIYEELLISISHLKNSKLRTDKIIAKIQSLDNNYFNEKFNDPFLIHYLSTYKDNEAKFHMFINKLTDLQSQVKHQLTNNCDHEWINDTIDIDMDTSKEICYCVKCEVSKK